MVLSHEFDVDRVVRDAWPDAVRHPIWGGLGYCFVDSSTRSDPEPPRPPNRSNRT